jgi:hypothetical protein
MGFDRIILCGAPISGGTGYYYEPYRERKKSLLPVRLGHLSHESKAIKRHQDFIREEFPWRDWPQVKSMGGFTADYFGTPDFMGHV